MKPWWLHWCATSGECGERRQLLLHITANCASPNQFACQSVGFPEIGLPYLIHATWKGICFHSRASFSVCVRTAASARPVYPPESPNSLPGPGVRSSRRAARTAEWHLGDFCCSTVSQRTCSIECIAYVPWSMFAVAFPKADSPEGRLRVGYGRSPRPIQCPLFNLGAVVSDY